MAYYTTKKSYLFEFDDSNHQILPNYQEIPPLTEILLSSHKLAGFDQVIGEINRDDYVMCVSYYSNGEIRDTQLGITGSLMIKRQDIESPPGLNSSPYIIEEIDDGCVRECAEELGIIPKKDYFSNNFSAVHILRRGNKQDVYTKTIDIKYCESYDPTIHQGLNLEACDGWFDNRSQKVQILVHGKLCDLIGVIKNIKHRIPSNDLETLKGIRLLHQKDVYNGMKFLNTVERQKRYKKNNK